MTSTERLDLVRRHLVAYKDVDTYGKARDPVGWIASRLSCTRREAVNLIDEADRQTSPDATQRVVPAEIAAVVVSEHPERLQLLIDRLVTGRAYFSQEEIVGLVGLIGDLVRDRARQRRIIDRVRECAEVVEQSSQALHEVASGISAVVDSRESESEDEG